MFIFSVTLPLWVYTVDYYYFNKSLVDTEPTNDKWPTIESTYRLLPTPVPQLAAFEVVLVVNALAHLSGLLVRRYRPVCSENFLAWFSRPFLLLFTLVFSTLGVYINIYSFDVRPIYELFVVAFSLPVTGYAFATLMSLVGRLPVAVRSHAGTESAVVNCLMASTAFRFGVDCDVEADVYCAAALLVVCATPVFLICAFVCRRLLRCVSHRVKPAEPAVGKPETECQGNRKISPAVSEEDNCGSPEAANESARCVRCGRDIRDSGASAASANLLPKSRSQITQADELEISVIVVDEKVTVV